MSEGRLARRQLLALMATAASACSRDAANDSSAATLPEVPAPEGLTQDPFTLGVASGDPLPDAVVIWTRLAPTPLEGGGMPPGDVEIGWVVALDPELKQLVQSGVVSADERWAHSVRLDVSGLSADQVYYFAFWVGDWRSPVGRTRTTPAADASVSALRFAVAACQDYRDGYWTAYSDLVNQEPDFVFFLGDYIYENGGSELRQHVGGEAQDLEGYRQRYAQYRSDPLLQAAHAVCPWIVTWDDHEVDNDYAPGSPDPDAAVSGAAFEERRRHAYQAYWEHMPLRAPAPEDGLSLHRVLAFGDLLQVIVGDTRQHRDPGACNHGTELPCDELGDSGWSMLGSEQLTWTLDELESSQTRWTVFAQSLIFCDLSFESGAFTHVDQWDGYPVERQRIVDQVAAHVEGFLVVSGDRHAAVLGAIHEQVSDPSSRVVGVEVSGNSISSDGHPDLIEAAFKAGWADRDNIEYAYAERRGYALCDLTRDELRVSFRIVETVLEPDSPIVTHAEFRVQRTDLLIEPA